MTDIYLQKVIPADNDSGYTVTKEYKLSNINSFSTDLNSPVSPMPLPEEGADSNILVKIEGNSSTISLAWTVKNETTTPVTVTTSGATSDVLTALQQVGYFTNEPGEGSFQPVSVADAYRIQLKDGSDIVWQKLGFFTKFTLSMAGNSPVIWNANVSFIVGDVVTSYQSKVPEVPTGLGLTVGASYNGSNVNTASIKVIWDPPVITNGTLTQTVVAYRKSGENNWHKLYTSTTDPSSGSEYVLSNLTYQKYYDIRVASRTNAGSGDFTSSKPGQAT
jgi:hypothetical protein